MYNNYRISHITPWLQFLKENHEDYASITISDENLLTYSTENFENTLKDSITVVPDNANVDSMREAGIACDTNVYDNITHIGQLQVSYLTDDNASAKTLQEIAQETRTIETNDDQETHITMQAGSELLHTSAKDFFALAFPYAFPFKRGHPNATGRKRVPMTLQEEIQHIMLKWKGRGKSVVHLLLTAFDIIQWRQYLNGINACVKETSASYMEIISKMTMKDVEDAIAAKISGEQANATTTAVFKAMNIISKVAPFSQLTKRKNLQELTATMINKGSPSLYLTMTPDDTKHPLAFALQVNDPTSFDWDKDYDMITSKAFRQTLAKNNPVGCSLFFHHIVSEILNNLCSTNQTGIFGDIAAYYGMVETQGRGTLHIHILLWIKNDLPKLQLFDTLQTDEDLKTKICEYLDSIIQSDILPIPKCNEDYCNYKTCDKTMSYWPAPQMDVNFQHQAAHMLYQAIRSYQFHLHTLSCKKNDATKCRYRKPAKETEETFFDTQSGMFHTRCNDGLVNFHNWILLLLTNSNMDLAYLHSGKIINIRIVSNIYIYVCYKLHL